MAKGKEMVKHVPAPVAPPRVLEPWEEKLAQRAKDTKSALTVGVPRIGHKGSILTIDKQRVAGNKLAVVVLGMAWAKEFYEKEYEEGANDTPVCYAFGPKERGLVPHEAVPDKQSATCDACPHNKFGTALKGAGKRCQDKPRLLVLLASDIAARGDQPVERVISKAQHYQMSVPATSLSAKDAESGLGLNRYVASLAESTPHGDLTEAITQISTEGRQNGGYYVVFNKLGDTPPEAMPFLAARSENVLEIVAQPFPALAEEGAAKADDKPIKGQKRK